MGLVDLGKELRISQRPLDIIYVIDTSLSMNDCTEFEKTAILELTIGGNRDII